jgi:AraC-like DNA-binding protein
MGLISTKFEMNAKRKPTTDINSLFCSADGVVQQFAMPFEDRKGEIKVVSANNNVIIDSSTVTKRLTASWQHLNERSFLELNFMLEGSMYQSQGSLLKKQRFDKGYYNLLFNPGTIEESEFIGTGRFRTVGIHIAPERAKTLFTSDIPELTYLAEKIENQEPFLFQNGAVGLNNSMKYLLDSLWIHADSAGLAKLHFEAYNLELLSLVCASLIHRDKKYNETFINKADTEKLYYAHEVLLSNLAEPPQIHELAALCGLNEFKLKKGFKQLFQTSILAFVNERRLQSARTAIYLREKTISEIAYELGFAHPQHFHRAFKKRFGETPMSLIRN